MSLPKILVVEDEKAHRLIIQKTLGSQYDLVFASNYSEGKNLIQSGEIFDLILLDIMLDESDGFELCAQIKSSDHLRFQPIIFLSAKSEVSSKVLGFTLGADDYIVKPCDPMELRARIAAKIKRTKEIESRDQNLVVADLVFDLERQVLELKGQEGVELCELTPMEFKLMYYLARHKEHVLSRDQILDNVWGQATNVLDRTVDTFIATLRKKLGERGSYIKSVHGVGYRFSPQSKASKAS